MSKIGFTGTRNGMTVQQKISFCRLMAELVPVEEFHHGDCVGADDDAANMVHEFNDMGGSRWKIVCHPPSDVKLRAFNNNEDEGREPKTHFARNRDIVDETDLLIACPPTEPLPASGGTAYTVNYAVKRKKPVKIIWPCGRVEDR